MKTGFARLDITPPLGTFLCGNNAERYANGITTPLQVSAVAYCDGENTAVTVSIDIISIAQTEMKELRRRAADRNGLPEEAIFLACTHIHTGPLVKNGSPKSNPIYTEFLYSRVSDAISLAIADLKETKMEAARGEAKGISFVRRFLMKDGSTSTNPFDNPDIVGAIGTPDETVQLVKLLREEGDDIYVVNFQVHPDVLTQEDGNKICSDFPGYVRETVEAALPGVKAIYFNGAQGDTNHIDIAHLDRFGKAHSRHMGRVIAGAVLSVCSYAEPVRADKVSFGQMDVEVPLSKATPEQIERAKALCAAFAERGSEALSPGMLGTTELAEARKFILLESAPDTKTLSVTGVRVGDVAWIGFPGEPFTDVGRGVKEASPFAMTIPCCCTFGDEGYYPMRSAFEEGGYEARSSCYRAGVAEALIDGGIALAKRLKG